MSTLRRLDASPANQLARVRGVIKRAQQGYPGNLHLHVRDGEGAEWRFVSWDADWDPLETSSLVGKRVNDVVLEPSGRLVFDVSGDVQLVVTPRPSGGPGDSTYWELLTPDGLSLEFGPGSRWSVQRSSDPC